jgi:hypothetical protein
MRVIIALIVVADFLSLGGCSRNNQRAYAKPMPSAAPQYSTRASSEKPPTLPARKFAKARAPRPPSGSPSVSGLPPAIAKHYVVQDTVGNCAVVDSKPGAGLKIIGGYSSLEVANKALKTPSLSAKTSWVEEFSTTRLSKSQRSSSRPPKQKHKSSAFTSSPKRTSKV